MRLTRIYTSQKLTSNTAVTLEPEPSRHIARALRMGVGETLTLFDGRGGEYVADITAVTRQCVTLRTGEQQPGLAESPLAIQLGIAVSRGERMDWVMQKATELGVASIAPLRSENCAVKLSAERAEKKWRHWQQIINSACEQSGRCHIPQVQPINSLGQWITAADAQRKFILDPGVAASQLGAPPPASVALLVGPEGGFSDAELEAAEAEGFQALRLGPRVLRTETAPLAAIALLQGLWGDMQAGD